ncbi:CLUMA_CG020695, isoform A [Clunio marinus]|uniref:alkaline phosphatase n=1 Tax=Clunio marinus TaxID=568069 RepID=A0A1J1J5S6_9DIPT|nr:CLUMA_CG020695, isoform A [Clunio marinus]
MRVKNVILFVGDGMGLTTVTASRVHKKQKLDNFEALLSFDEFPASAMIRTDTANTQISESAAAATALFCGVKTNFENLGVDITADHEICNNIDSDTPSIISWAQNENLKTGFVTTTRITHATPAALYAHSRRHMEDDSKIDTTCKDIARQLIEDETGRRLNVIMGGGHRSFIPESESEGRRKDGRNLIKTWKNDHPNGEFVTDRWQMMNISDDTEHVLGLFSSSHMKFNADRDKEAEPSLAEMTKMAIKVLKRNNRNGFMLIVEAGKIDLAHHFNNAFRALDDTLALDKAVEVAVKNVDLTNSLIIVTSDHSSPMIYSGYATPKEHSILGMDKYLSNVDKRPYQLLMYSSGLGFENYQENLAKSDHRNAYHKAAVPLTWANHGGDDVPLYATGSMSNLLFSGSLDQTYIPHAIAFAMCLFDYKDRCYGHVIDQRNEIIRGKKPSSIHLLKEELEKESFMQQQKEIFKKEGNEIINKLDDEILFSNVTDLDTVLTSDLVGNLSIQEGSKASCCYLWKFLYLIINLVLINVR